MNVCPGCGMPLEAQQMFCANCGCQISEAELPAEQEMKKSKKKIILFGSIAGVLVIAIAALVLFFSWYNSDEQQVMRALESGDYMTALELVDENIALRTNDELVEMLGNRLTILKSDFKAGKIQYAKLTDELDTIEEMKVKDVLDELEELRTYAQKLNESRTHFSTAEEFFAVGDYPEAIDHYKLVVEDDSNYDTAKSRLTEAQDKFRQEKLDEAAELADEEDYSAAVAILQDALKVLPEDSEITQKIALYENNYADKQKEDALTTADAYAEAGDYVSAITVLEDYLETVPNETEVTQKLQSYQTAYDNTVRENVLDEASSYATYGDYLSALRVLNNYTDTYGAHVDITVAYNGYKESYVVAVLEDAETTAQSGDYVGAMAMITAAKANVEDTRLDNKLSSYEDSFVSAVIAQSDALLEDEKYDEAYSVVEVAIRNLSLFDKLERLDEQLKKIEDKRPKNFMDVCAPYNQDDGSGCALYTNGESFIMAGQEYSNGFMLGTWTTGWDTWALSNLGGQYSELSFVVGHVDGSRNQDVTLCIYLDGKLYDTYDVHSDGLPSTISIPVEGVHQIKFFIQSCQPNIGFANISIR